MLVATVIAAGGRTDQPNEIGLNGLPSVQGKGTTQR
jgi:hypothetical protein